MKFILILFLFIISSSIVFAQSSEMFDSVAVKSLPESKGMQEFRYAISNNFKITKEMKKAKLYGKIVCSFIVEKDGSIKEVEVLEHLGYGTKEALLESFRKYSAKNKWSPGLQNGNPVRVKYSMPISIDLRR